jgi:hypothetical protein
MVVGVLVVVRLGVLIERLIEQRNGKQHDEIILLQSMMRLLVSR